MLQYYIYERPEAVRVLKIAVCTLFIALVFIFPYTSQGQTWDSIKKVFVPDDVAERPPEVSHVDDLENDTFTRGNFYNKSAGTRQYRRSMMAPTKSMDFKVINPLEQSDPDEGPGTQAQIVEKNGKAVTVISIDKDSESQTK